MENVLQKGVQGLIGIDAPQILPLGCVIFVHIFVLSSLTALSRSALHLKRSSIRADIWFENAKSRHLYALLRNATGSVLRLSMDSSYIPTNPAICASFTADWCNDPRQLTTGSPQLDGVFGVLCLIPLSIVGCHDYSPKGDCQA